MNRLWECPIEHILFIWEGDLSVDAKKVGKAIKVLRNRIGYTQHDLADTLGVTDKAVSNCNSAFSYSKL